MPRERTVLARARCMFPGCLRGDVVRGMCRTHDNARRRGIADKGLTWEQYEKAGLARPKKQTALEYLMERVKESEIAS